MDEPAIFGPLNLDVGGLKGGAVAPHGYRKRRGDGPRRNGGKWAPEEGGEMGPARGPCENCGFLRATLASIVNGAQETIAHSMAERIKENFF